MTESNPVPESVSDDIPENAWTVEQLNHTIKEVLTGARDQFPTHVIGEVADVDQYEFGTFFELRDLDADPSIGCLAWASSVADFDHELEAGTKAVVEASVDFYPERGDCQLLVSDYWPIGESARYQELSQLRKQLEDEGLFDEERKQAIPGYPACVGAVTSPSGSAIEDLWTAISDRSPRTDLKLHGATVQGEHAVESILKALDTLDQDPEVETIVLTRGGGSDVHLWAFNAEPLVRRVAACQTPTIVAIGHEDDQTLVEAVADKRAMTPTEAGVISTTDWTTTADNLESLERRIHTAYHSFVDDHLDTLDRRIDSAMAAVEQQATEYQSQKQRARDLEQRIIAVYDRLVERRLQNVDERIGTALTDVEVAAQSEAATERVARGRLSDLEARINGAYRNQVNQELDTLEQRITTAYQDLEADARVEAGRQEAQRLRKIVFVLLGIIIIGGLAVAIWLLF